MPFILVLIEWGAKLFSFGIFQFIHNFFIACFAALFLSFLLRNYHLGLALHLFLCLAMGVIFAVTYEKSRIIKSFLDLLTPAILIVPFLFIYQSQMIHNVFNPKRIVTQKNEDLPLYAKEPVPVILLLFDEFSAVSLFDENKKVDPVLYPNFYSLSQQSHWFRRATTVSASTPYALTALFTGKRLPLGPSYKILPQNLFTLLGEYYNLYVQEIVSSCCPSYLNKACIAAPSFYKRFASVFIDAFVVNLHFFVPDTLKDKLPVIHSQWTGFTKWTAKTGKISQDLLKQEFKEPSFFYLYMNVPHEPWNYLPSGKTYFYEPPPGWDSKAKKWSTNEWLVTQAYQRYLLQVGYADKLLGDLIAFFKEKNIFDRSLFIVLADHGISFAPNESKRDVLGKTNYLEVLNIPLFIKLPHQKQGMINDNPVDITDVLPTIADVLKCPLPWVTNGTSVFSQAYPPKEKLHLFIFVDHERSLDQTFEVRQLEDLDKVHQKKLTLFGSESFTTQSPFHIGPFPELLGRNKKNIDLGTRDDLSVEFERQNTSCSKEMFSQTYIKGYLKSMLNEEAPFYLAILVNDTIEALTQTYVDSEGRRAFSAMIPERALKAGINNIEILLIEETDHGPRLFSLRESSAKLDDRFIYGVDLNKITFLCQEDLPLVDPDLPLTGDIFWLNTPKTFDGERSSSSSTVFLKKIIDSAEHSLIQSKELDYSVHAQNQSSKELGQQIALRFSKDLEKCESKPGWLWWRNEKMILVNSAKHEVPISLSLKITSYEIDRALYFILNSQTLQIENLKANEEKDVIVHEIILKPGANELQLYSPEGHSAGKVRFAFKKDSLRMVSFLYEIPCRIKTKENFILRYYPGMLPVSSEIKEMFIGPKKITLKELKGNRRKYYEGKITLTPDTVKIAFKKSEQLNDFIEVIPVAKQIAPERNKVRQTPSLDYETISSSAYKIKVDTDSNNPKGRVPRALPVGE